MSPDGSMSSLLHTGLAGSDEDGIKARLLPAWDNFLAVAQSADLDAPSRLPGWTGRELCIHLGVWDDSNALDTLLTAARTGELGERPQPDDDNATLIAAHADASAEDVLAAVRRSRSAVAAFLESQELQQLAMKPVMSPLGPVPLLTAVNAGAYELALHALDLAPCGAFAPDDALLDTGLSTLVDVTGALAVRHRLSAGVSVVTGKTGWAFTSSEDGWQTERLTDLDGLPPGSVLSGDAAAILDASAGRANAPSMLMDGRLKVQDMGGLLKLAPLVEDISGLPGGEGLRVAAKVLGGLSHGAGSLKNLLRGRRP